MLADLIQQRNGDAVTRRKITNTFLQDVLMLLAFLIIIYLLAGCATSPAALSNAVRQELYEIQDDELKHCDRNLLKVELENQDLKEENSNLRIQLIEARAYCEPKGEHNGN